jgi:hypothetical protein
MRLIDADALLKDIKGRKTRTYPKGELEWTIEQQPTIKAVPVVHGEWIARNPLNPDSDKYCSNCKHDISAIKAVYYDFCPACGTYMRGKEHIDEDTKLVIDEDGVMYRVVSRERALKAIDKWEKVVKERTEEMRGKEQI